MSSPINQSYTPTTSTEIDHDENSCLSDEPHNPSSQSESPTLLRSPTAILHQASVYNQNIGDDMIQKDPKHLRIILQNPNGISPENDLFEYEYCLQQMHSLCADVILLPESNLFWPTYSIQKSMSNHRRNIHRHSKQITSCSTKSYGSVYQPGGTCSIITGHATGRFHSSQRDEQLGRWSVMHLNQSDSSVLSIICCYQVCKDTIKTSGPKTAFSQQWSLLQDSGVLNPNPRRQFIKDLDKLLKTLTNSGNSIVLAGDFNESIGDNHEGLDRLLVKYNLVDTVTYCHGSHDNVPTYSRGSKRIANLATSIAQTGIPTFDSIIPSDHRPIFLDLDAVKAFGNNTSALVSPPARRLHSRHEDNVKLYIKLLSEKMDSHNIFKRTQTLDETEQSTESSDQLAEAIDRDMTRLMLHCEKQLHKPSPTPFSSNLAQSCLAVSILKLHLRIQRFKVDKSLSVQAYQAKRKKPVPLPNTIPETKAALKKARKEVKDIRKRAIAEREDFLCLLIAGCNDPAVVKRIKQAEELKRSYEKIRHIMRPSSAALVTQVEVPDDDLPPKQCQKWKRVTDPKEVTKIIFERNVKHFQGANGTPFTVEPLASLFNWSATSPSHANTLDGNPPPHQNRLVNLLLSHSHRKIESFEPTVTMKELVKRLRRWKENTSTSPSQRHLGHYKCLVPPFNYQMEEFAQTDQYSILQVHLSLLNYCARTGYSLNRWQSIVTTTIPKETGNFKLHRLRVIHLYEADLTALFSIWSKKMIHNSETKQTINPGSFGARPGRTSTDPPYIQVLQTEIAPLSWSSLANCPNDATQCYDRIIPNHAMLSAASHGMPPSAATCIGSTLQLARYHLRTALSQTQEYWTNRPGNPMFGTGQGSAISPSLCSVTFSDAMDVHSSISHGSKYVCPFDTIRASIDNIGYVDDTNTTTNDLLDPLSPDVLKSRLHHSVQNWHDLLTVLGGAIEFTKTELFLLSWKFSHDGYPVPVDHSACSLTFIKSANETTSIDFSPVSKAYKTLGFHLCMNQDNSTQFKQLRDKSHEMANGICGSSCNHRDSFLCYFAVYYPSISYVLPLTTFSEQQCKAISAKPTQLFLQKCGFASSTPRAVVYASRKSGGLGFRHLYTEQGIAHVVKLIQTLRTPCEANQLTRIALSWWHVNAGVGFDMLSDPQTPVHHLEGTWLTSTRLFLQSIHASIHFSFRTHSLHYRVHDCHIMDKFSECLPYGRHRLRLLNFCRLHLQVSCLSELTNTAGTHLIPKFWCGDVSKRQSSSTHRYPNQASPSAKAWSLWRSAIRTAFCHPRSTRLKEPLGAWTSPLHRRHLVLSLDPPRLWNTSTSIDRFHTILYVRNGRFRFSTAVSPGTIPDVVSPAIRVSSTDEFITVRLAPCQFPVSPPPPTNILDAISSLVGWRHFLLEHLQVHRCHDDVVRALTSTVVASVPSPSDPTVSDLLAASDGGHKMKFSTFGWTIRLADKDLATCFGPVHGFDTTNYRAECHGLLSLLTYIHLLCQYYPSVDESCHLHVYIDNSSLLSRVLQHQQRLYYSPSEALFPEHDCILQIESLLDSVPVHFTFTHIKSHQDDDRDVSDLSPASRANVRADSLATHARSVTTRRSITPLFDAAVCDLRIGDRSITHHAASSIRHFAFDLPFREHVIQSRQWSSVDEIDWSFLGKQCARNSHRLHFCLKLVHRLLPTGKVLHRRNPIESPYCPACGEVESNEHFLLCSHSSRLPRLLQLVVQVRRAVDPIQSDPILKDILIEGVDSVILDREFPFHLFPVRYQSLCCSQANIGWLNLLRGFVSCHWLRLQDEYFHSHSLSDSCGRPGVLSVMNTIWTSLHDLWQFRNAQRHGKELAAQETEQVRQITIQLTELYQFRHRVLPEHRDLFRPSLDEHLREPTADLVAWFANHSDRLRASHLAAVASNVTHTRPITSYFQ